MLHRISLAILLLCSVFVQGQTTTASNRDSMFLPMGTFSFVTGVPDEYKYDTISAILLVSDTLHYSNYTPAFSNANYFDRAGLVNWVTAFAVRKITIEKKGYHYRNGSMWHNATDEYYYNTEKYLDGLMRPLSSSVKVWMAVSN